MTETPKRGYRGLDVIGIALILFGILWLLFRPAPRYDGIGSYSIAELLPVLLGVIGVVCIVVARFKR